MAIRYRSSAPAKITLNPDDASVTLFGLMTFYVILDDNKLVDCFTLNMVCIQLWFSLSRGNASVQFAHSLETLNQLSASSCILIISGNDLSLYDWSISLSHDDEYPPFLGGI
jgi:hypothetical protein